MPQLCAYYSLFKFHQWAFYIAATNKGLCFVGSMPASEEECLNWLSIHLTDHTSEHSDAHLMRYCEAFRSFLSGTSTTIDGPIILIGSTFQKQVWSSLKTIPYGKTMTYGELALNNGLSSKYARAVGTAIGRNPLLIVYPCHRVVPKSSPSKRFRGGLIMKQMLLSLERHHFESLNY
ncbi:hypothetical protein P9112_008057 [Eukaryota sp. TZLM1-RC]